MASVDDQDDDIDDTDARLRGLLAAALLSIIVGGTADLVMDNPQSWLSFHVIFEVTMIAGALLMATTLWLGWWRSAHAAKALVVRLAEQAVERDRWRANSQEALEGLGRAIDAQFEAWRLTPAEREVAQLVLKGYGHKEIAALSGRSERTVRQHAGVVYEKAGLGGRAALSAYFLQDLMLPELRPDGGGRALLPDDVAENPSGGQPASRATGRAVLTRHRPGAVFSSPVPHPTACGGARLAT